VLTELNILSHFFCFFPYGRKAILRLFLSPAGYYVLKLNRQKRRFRNWRAGLAARWRRRRDPEKYSARHAASGDGEGRSP
jgi:hypothetical protein